MPLRPLVEEVGDGLGLPREGSVDWTIAMDATLRVDADRDQLFRVLSNLTRNALQAIEQQDNMGGHIRVVALRDGKRVTIEVSDNGPGVPEKARTHLFQAFQGSARKGGTGLGLAVAQELVNAHGGTIRLRDTGKGRDFRARDPRPRRVRGPCEIRSTPSSTWPSSAAASTAAASPATLPAAAGRCSCARWATLPAAPPRAPPS